MSLRRAEPADASAVRELTRAAYAKWVPVTGGEPLPMTADYDQAVRRHLIDLYEEGGELHALIEMVVESGHLLIENIAVRQQGKGIGDRLLRHAEDVAASMNIPEVRLLAGGEMLSITQRQHMPLFAAYRADAVAGALMGFGASFVSQYRLATDYVDKILRGAKPTDLPVQQPTALDLVINLKVAKALGIEIPQLVLARATELIE